MAPARNPPRRKTPTTRRRKRQRGTHRWGAPRYGHIKAAYRSGLEEKIGEQIRRAGGVAYYEVLKIPYEIPAKKHKYTPDWVLPNGIIVETKGLFQTHDRQKMVIVKAQHPDLDIRFVFSNANARIAKKSKTTYGKWAEDHGFKWSHRDIPTEWLREEVNAKSLAAIERLGFKPRG